MRTLGGDLLVVEAVAGHLGGEVGPVPGVVEAGDVEAAGDDGALHLVGVGVLHGAQRRPAGAR